MCPESLWIVTPKAIEAILLRRVHKPVPRVMCDAQPRHGAARIGVRKTWFHYGGADWEGFADVGADVVNKVSNIALRNSTSHDMNIRRVVDRSL